MLRTERCLILLHKTTMRTENYHMYKHFKLLLLLCTGLLAVVFLLPTTPASAASLTPDRPLPGGCPNASQRAYGVSYDADTASPAVSSIFGEAFSFTQTTT